ERTGRSEHERDAGFSGRSGPAAAGAVSLERPITQMRQHGKHSNTPLRRVSAPMATAAGMFTTNAVRAAPVIVCQEKIQLGAAQAIVVNSGNANACTGAQGLADGREM